MENLEKGRRNYTLENVREILNYLKERHLDGTAPYRQFSELEQKLKEKK